MARQQRSTTFTQESTRPSYSGRTLREGQHLKQSRSRDAASGTAGIRRTPRLADCRRIHRSRGVGLQGVAAGTQSADGIQIIGAMVEFERALIQERVRAGLRNARAKGRRLGRPRVIVDASQIACLRSQGRSWAQITDEIVVSKGTAQRAVVGLPKIG